MSNVELTGIRKNFGAVEVIRDVDLSIEDGEFVVFVGPSGCGKSTLLRLIAGLEEISSGSIDIGGRDVTWSEPAQRGVAMVFQSYALYPHMSVAENMAFGLRMNGATREEIGARVSRAAGILHLEELLERKPRQLSGGQRQRVAIGRAIVREPAVFLFDEPLSNLDAELRVQMRLEIAKLHQELGTTMIYVTHDQVEAMTLADKIVILHAGRIEQVGSPLELYDEPENQFVAGFIGSPGMNFLRGVIGGTTDGMTTIGLTDFGGSEFRVRLDSRVPTPGSTIRIGIRPEHLDAPEGVGLRARIDVVEHLGGASYAHAGLNTDVGLTVAIGEDRAMRAGQELNVHFRPERAYLFDPESGARIR